MPIDLPALPQVKKLLLNRGADINLPDYRGLTPLKLAKRYGQDEIEEALAARGAILELPKDDVKKEKAEESLVVDPPWKRQSYSR